MRLVPGVSFFTTEDLIRSSQTERAVSYCSALIKALRYSALFVDLSLVSRSILRNVLSDSLTKDCSRKNWTSDNCIVGSLLARFFKIARLFPENCQRRSS